MQDLIILGAGGTSREIAGVVENINARRPTWNLLGFLDDDARKHGTPVDGYPVLGPLAAAGGLRARVIVGVASARNGWARKAIVERLGLGPERFATLIDPSASVSRHARVAEGAAILQNVVVTSGAVIGRHTLILQGVSMAHDARVDEYATVAPAAVLSGSVHLFPGVYVGTGAVVMDGVTVGEGALAGIGSVVVSDVPAGMTAFGNPARNMPAMRRR